MNTWFDAEFQRILEWASWERCPKATYVEHSTVALATYLAVLQFNDEDISFLKILRTWILHLQYLPLKVPKNVISNG